MINAKEKWYSHKYNYFLCVINTKIYKTNKKLNKITKYIEVLILLCVLLLTQNFIMISIISLRKTMTFHWPSFVNTSFSVLCKKYIQKYTKTKNTFVNKTKLYIVFKPLSTLCNYSFFEKNISCRYLEALICQKIKIIKIMLRICQT